MTQRTKFKITVYIILFIIASSLTFWWYSHNSAKERDYARLGDLKVIQGEMTRYFLKNNTYLIPGCQNGFLLNDCLGDSNKPAQFGDIIDPLGSRGFFYIVNSLSNSDYQIGFGLETSIGGLKPGNHILSKNGAVK